MIIVHGGITAGDEDLRPVPELARQAGQFSNGACELRVLHRRRRVDEKPWPRPWLIERRHDELAVGRLPAMRSSIRAVVATERAVA